MRRGRKCTWRGGAQGMLAIHRAPCTWSLRRATGIMTSVRRRVHVPAARRNGTCALSPSVAQTRTRPVLEAAEPHQARCLGSCADMCRSESSFRRYVVRDRAPQRIQLPTTDSPIAPMGIIIIAKPSVYCDRASHIKYKTPPPAAYSAVTPSSSHRSVCLRLHNIVEPMKKPKNSTVCMTSQSQRTTKFALP